MKTPLLRWALLVQLAGPVLADGPKDNLPDSVRRIPPEGVAIGASERVELEAKVAELGAEIGRVRQALAKKPDLLQLLPDVEVLHKAVDWPLRYNEFYKPQELNAARDLLKEGFERAAALKAGTAPWLNQTGLVVRGYRSDLDGSVQPFGLVVPKGAVNGAQVRLDFWCHGRGETLTELAFLDQRRKTVGQIAPEGALVVHLYGRYCCANKFAGEVDLFEALAKVRRDYRIDPNRLFIRGFSMGGAAAWHFAVHYPSLWAGAAPGAGFSETPEFLKVFQDEKLEPAWYERRLWHWYDATDYAANLGNFPTVAYSGETDRQKQAADIMETALAAEGMALTHLIGPGTAHAYHPDSAREIARRLDSVAVRGRDPVPKTVRFTTWTLRYPECFWVRLEGLGRHWERARVEGVLEPWGVRLSASNVTALSLNFDSGLSPFDGKLPVKAVVDGEEVLLGKPGSDRSFHARLERRNGRWSAVDGRAVEASGVLAKRPGLQGPLDDAFLSRFVMVGPSRAPLNAAVGNWVTREFAHARDHWRLQFRGEAPVRDEVSDADLADANLILWGDPQSNPWIAKVLEKLPFKWGPDGLEFGGQRYDTAQHVPVLVFPNPLNPRRYVVLNSGFTYREYDYLNNARQVPKLPDYAVLDVRQPANSRLPGGVVRAGFFGENWEFLEGDGQ